METDGPIDFDVIINDRSWSSFFDRADRQMRGLRATAQRETGQIDQLFNQLGQRAAGVFAFAGLSELPSQLIKVRGEFQQLEIAFTTMLRSKEKSDTLIRSLSTEALKSPFELSDLAKGAKQLLAYGGNAETVVDELRMLGNIASGVSVDIGSLVYLYGTLRQQGRAYAVDLRQFASRGIGIYSELAKVLKVNVDQINGLVEAGKVGFKEVEQAFKNMTSSGGIFENLMEKQAQSLTGLASNFKDAWAQMLNEIGKETEGPIGNAIRSATELTTNYKEVAKYLSAIAAGYGTYKAAVVIANTAQQVNLVLTQTMAVQQGLAKLSGDALTQSQLRQAAVTSLLSRAQAQLNATMLANPYIAVATVLATLVAAYFAFREETIEVKTAQQLLGEATTDINKRVGEQAGEVKALTGILKNQNVAESERLKAYNRLREISPDIVRGLDFQRSKTADLTNEVNNYISALRRQISLEVYSTKYKEAFTKQIEAQDNVDKKRQEFLDKQKAAQDSQKADPRANGGASAFNYSSGGGSAAAAMAAMARQAFESAVDAKQQADRAIGELDKVMGSVYQQGTKQGLETQKKKLEIQLSQLGQLNKLSKAYKYTEEQLASVNKQLDTLNSNPKADQSFADRLAKANDAGTLRMVASYAKTDKLRDELIKKVKDKKTDAVDGSKEKAALEKLESDLEKLTAKGRAMAEKAATKEAEKEGVFGSEQYWSNIVDKADELIRKTTDPKIQQQQQAIKDNALQQVELIRRSVEAPLGTIPYFEALIADANKALEKLPEGADPAKIATQQYIITQAQQKADELRKRNAIKSFEETIEEKQRQYELYERWVTAYGQEAADRQFASLKESGTSYLDYLDKQIAALESKQGAGVLSEKEAQNLANLIGQKNGLTGGKSPIEAFTDQLQRAKVEAGSLAQYLKYLEAEQAKLNPADKSALASEKRVVLQKQTIETKDNQEEQLGQLLQEVIAGEQERLAITARFADLRAAVDRRANGLRTQAVTDQIEQVNRAEADALDQFEQKQLARTEAVRNASKVILETGQAELRQRIKNQEATVANAKTIAEKRFGDGKEMLSETYKAELKKLQDLQKQFSDNQLANWARFGQLAGELGQSLSGLGGVAGQVGSLLMGMASQVGGLTKAFEKNLSTGDAVGIAISGISNLIGSIASASEERRRKETEFYLSTNAQQAQYNLLLNEQLGLQAKGRSSVFVRDFVGELKDGITRYADAQKNFQLSLAKLSEGRAKIGLKDQIDLGKLGASTLSGAATGAAIGSAVPIIGTAVGAVGGAVVGFLSGIFGSAREKAEQFAGLLETYPKLIREGADGMAEINKELAQSLISQNQVDDQTKQLLQTTVDWQKAMEESRAQIKGIISDLAGGLGNSLRDNLVNAFKAGTSAAEAFADSVSQTLENMLSQLLFNQLFSNQFKQLQAEMEASYGLNGDQSWTDDVVRFYKQAGPLVDKFNGAMQAAQVASSQYGLDVFKKNTNTTNTSLSGAIKGVTEETASVLAGQMNAIRITQADSAAVLRNQLLHLSEIASNTRYLRTIDRSLEEIKAGAKADPIRARGGWPP